MGTVTDIRIAKRTGFCYGVREAIDMAKEASAAGKVTHTLGQVVHNEGVVQDLQALGIQTVETLDDVDRGAAVVIRAHGVKPEVMARAQERGHGSEHRQGGRTVDPPPCERRLGRPCSSGDRIHGLVPAERRVRRDPQQEDDQGERSDREDNEPRLDTPRDADPFQIRRPGDHPQTDRQGHPHHRAGKDEIRQEQRSAHLEPEPHAETADSDEQRDRSRDDEIGAPGHESLVRLPDTPEPEARDGEGEDAQSNRRRQRRIAGSWSGRAAGKPWNQGSGDRDHAQGCQANGDRSGSHPTARRRPRRRMSREAVLAGIAQGNSAPHEGEGAGRLWQRNAAQRSATRPLPAGCACRVRPCRWRAAGDLRITVVASVHVLPPARRPAPRP